MELWVFKMGIFLPDEDSVNGFVTVQNYLLF